MPLPGPPSGHTSIYTSSAISERSQRPSQSLSPNGANGETKYKDWDFAWYWIRRPEAAELRLEKREDSYRNETEILRKPTSSLPNPCRIELDNINLLITDEEFLEYCDWMARTAEWAGEPEIMALSRHCKKMSWRMRLIKAMAMVLGNGYGQKRLEMKGYWKGMARTHLEDRCEGEDTASEDRAGLCELIGRLRGLWNKIGALYRDKEDKGLPKKKRNRAVDHQ
ncbi:hypothetical protein PPACK8108_LOCUS7955 [Phakopsora pachyrhizi]|uniref:Uncharacterized protein n=1 Tax=Phakopsora pachyrhizi TaxID=170000 RepID=A0AAV0AUD0_PHAPC|nr:hypothetical protein PPACK8108_LOCUS7955 [Phakopsora pachyrhizi]